MTKPFRFLSVCSGIEAASVAWEPLGWECAAVAEIDPFASWVLHKRVGAGRPMFMPDPADAEDDKSAKGRRAALKSVAGIPEIGRIPNLGDLTKFKEWPDATELGSIDLLVGGTPCQAFSIAGLREGLADPRGNLSLTYVAIAERYRPQWFVWENVPGVLSSNEGRDFGSILGAMVELGYGVAYRVLDAQYIRVDGMERAVPQRRRRVILVGCLGDWRSAAAVLFEPDCLSGNPPPRREARKAAARGTAGGFDGGRREAGGERGERGDGGRRERLAGAVVGAVQTPPVAATLTRGAESSGRGGYAGRRQEDDSNLAAELTPFCEEVAATLRSASQSPASHGKVNGTDRMSLVAYRMLAMGEYADDNSASTMKARDYKMATDLVAHTLRAEGFDASEGGTGRGTPLVAVAFDSKESNTLCNVELSPCLTTNGETGKAGGRIAVQRGSAVRRLTPTECERLQGFPDGWTDVPVGNKAASDGARYKSLGNSFATNVVRWVGRRIQIVEQARAELASTDPYGLL